MYKPLADSTLMSMTKKEIIELLRIAERNTKELQAWRWINKRKTSRIGNQ